MDFLKSHLFSAFFIAILFFIVKALMKRLYKDETIQMKIIFKDSVLIFVLAYSGLIFRDNMLLYETANAQVFTTEPNF